MRVSFTLNHKPGTTKATNNTALTDADWAKLIPSNYLLHAMFEHINVKINGQDVINSPGHYHLRSYLEAFMAYSNTAKHSFLSAAFWQEDEAKRSHAIKPLTSENDKTKGRTLDLMGRLHIDLAQQERLLIGGNTVQFKLVPNDVKMFVKLTGEYVVKVNFHEAKLRTTASQVTAPLLTAHQRALAVNPCRYPISRTEIKVKPIAIGTGDAPWDNIFIGALPRRLFVVLMENEAFNGSLAHEMYTFKHHDLSSIAVFADGVQFPQVAFTPDFETKQCAREFIALYRSLDQNGTDSYMRMSMDEYIKDKVIIPFQLSPDSSNGAGAEGHLSPPRHGNLRMEIRFKKPLSAVVNCVVFAQFDNTIEIDQNHNVRTDFN